MNTKKLLSEKTHVRWTKGKWFIRTITTTNKDLLKAVIPLLKKLQDEKDWIPFYKGTTSALVAFMNYLEDLVK